MGNFSSTQDNSIFDLKSLQPDFIPSRSMTKQQLNKIWIKKLKNVQLPHPDQFLSLKKLGLLRKMHNNTLLFKGTLNNFLKISKNYSRLTTATIKIDDLSIHVISSITEFLANNLALKSLDLDLNGISDDSKFLSLFRILSKLSKLVTLTIRNFNIEKVNRNMSFSIPRQVFSKLKVLTLHEPSYLGFVLQYISKAPRLEEFNCKGQPLPTMELLSSFKNLKRVNIVVSGNGWEETIYHLVNLESLYICLVINTLLDESGRFSSNDYLRQFKQLTKLKSLKIDLDVQEIRTSRPIFPRIFSSQPERDFTSTLTWCTNLQVLSLIGFNLSSKEMIACLSSIPHPENISDLELEFTKRTEINYKDLRNYFLENILKFKSLKKTKLLVNYLNGTTVEILKSLFQRLGNLKSLRNMIFDLSGKSGYIDELYNCRAFKNIASSIKEIKMKLFWVSDKTLPSIVSLCLLEHATSIENLELQFSVLELAKPEVFAAGLIYKYVSKKLKRLTLNISCDNTTFSQAISLIENISHYKHLEHLRLHFSVRPQHETGNDSKPENKIIILESLRKLLGCLQSLESLDIDIVLEPHCIDSNEFWSMIYAFKKLVTLKSLRLSIYVGTIYINRLDTKYNKKIYQILSNLPCLKELKCFEDYEASTS